MALVGYTVCALIGLLTTDSNTTHLQQQADPIPIKDDNTDILELKEDAPNSFAPDPPHQPNPPAANQQKLSDMATTLQQLKSLLNEGILTQEEYNHQKNKY